MKINLDLNLKELELFLNLLKKNNTYENLIECEFQTKLKIKLTNVINLKKTEY